MPLIPITLRFQIFDLLHHRRIWSNRLNKQNVVSIDDNAIWRMPLLTPFYQDVDCLLGLLIDTTLDVVKHILQF